MSPCSCVPFLSLRLSLTSLTPPRQEYSWNKAHCESLLEEYNTQDYKDLMNSTFALVPGGRSPATYRLGEVLSAGCIPVFVHEVRCGRRACGGMHARRQQMCNVVLSKRRFGCRVFVWLLLLWSAPRIVSARCGSAAPGGCNVAYRRGDARYHPPEPGFPTTNATFSEGCGRDLSNTLFGADTVLAVE